MALASSSGRSIGRTPLKLLITEGTKAATKITMTFAASPRPSHTMASGIQASGGIGRSNRNTGLTNASTVRLAPIASPSSTPGVAATTKPNPTNPHRQPQQPARRSGDDKAQAPQPHAAQRMLMPERAAVAIEKDLLAGRQGLGRPRKAHAGHQTQSIGQTPPQQQQRAQRHQHAQQPPAQRKTSRAEAGTALQATGGKRMNGFRNGHPRLRRWFWG